VPPSKLLQQVRQQARLRHLSRRTEDAYARWVRRSVVFHGTRHPSELGSEEIRLFLTDLAMSRNVAASTQNQALAALLFLYRAVLGSKVEGLEEIVRARKPKRLPVVLTRDEARRVLREMTGAPRLVSGLLYGSGLRLLEALRLRVKDLDFEQRIVVVRDGKGRKDRVSVLPEQLGSPLRDHLRTVRVLHHADVQDGFGAVYLPDALERKYPSAARSWSWQYLFPARQRSLDPRSGVTRRHHLSERWSSGRSGRRSAAPAS
jgi:integron integrase